MYCTLLHLQFICMKNKWKMKLFVSIYLVSSKLKAMWLYIEHNIFRSMCQLMNYIYAFCYVPCILRCDKRLSNLAQKRIFMNEKSRGGENSLSVSWSRHINDVILIDNIHNIKHIQTLCIYVYTYTYINIVYINYIDVVWRISCAHNDDNMTTNNGNRHLNDT